MVLKRHSYWLVGSCLIVYATPVWAYLDPASGSILLQVLIAGVLSSIVTVKLYWQRIRSWLGRNRHEEKVVSTTPDSEN